MDKNSGPVHTMEVTLANVHDVTMTPQLLTGEEETVFGNSGYLGAERREAAENKAGKRIRYKINRRLSQIKDSNRSVKPSAENLIPGSAKTDCKTEYHVRLGEFDSG